MRGLPRREERIVASHFADLAWTRRAISAGVPRHAAGLFNRFGKRTTPGSASHRAYHTRCLGRFGLRS